MPHSEAPLWAQRHGGEWRLDLHVQPAARLTAAVGEHGGRLKLKIAAPAVDNKANAHLLAWLAAQWEVPRSVVRLVRGETVQTENRGGVQCRQTLAGACLMAIAKINKT